MVDTSIAGTSRTSGRRRRADHGARRPGRARARLLLAKDQLPSGGSIGYEIFDRGDSFTTSQFQQNINQLRALEGELARTIRAINGVRAVRVHLVLPKREPFSRDQQDAQASVLLTTDGAAAPRQRRRAGDPQPGGGRACPGCGPQNIAVVDSHGNLLARAGEHDRAVRPPRSRPRNCAAPWKRASAARSRRCWSASLGAGHVRAEATVEMDFDQVT